MDKGVMVVCAANRFEDGNMILGVRHWDENMHRQADALYGKDENPDCEQGFIDNRMNFLTREEAWHVAKASGQIRFQVSSDGYLFSENLY